MNTENKNPVLQVHPDVMSFLSNHHAWHSDDGNYYEIRTTYKKVGENLIQAVDNNPLDKPITGFDFQCWGWQLVHYDGKSSLLFKGIGEWDHIEICINAEAKFLQIVDLHAVYQGIALSIYSGTIPADGAFRMIMDLIKVPVDLNALTKKEDTNGTTVS